MLNEIGFNRNDNGCLLENAFKIETEKLKIEKNCSLKIIEVLTHKNAF